MARSLADATILPVPGAYALAMQATLVAGRWPNKLLTLALYYNSMHANHVNGQDDLNDFIVNNADQRASCHPNAIMFMNLVSSVNPGPLFPGDDVFGLAPHGKNGNAAQADVATGQTAMMLDEHAIWVKYGAHSFVLLTGRANHIESFEGWAGHPHGYFFHQSVCQEPDDLGHPRVANSRPTRATARDAIGDLISANVDERRDAVNALSRAGHGGFGGHHAGPAPGVDIHVTPTAAVATVKERFKRRLVGAGYYRAAAKERLHANSVVCCHCQASVINRVTASTGRWRECTTCNRHYCRQCKHLLSSHFRFLGIGTRVRVCDCGQDTQRI